MRFFFFALFLDETKTKIITEQMNTKKEESMNDAGVGTRRVTAEDAWPRNAREDTRGWRKIVRTPARIAYYYYGRGDFREIPLCKTRGRDAYDTTRRTCVCLAAAAESRQGKDHDHTITRQRDATDGMPAGECWTRAARVAINAHGSVRVRSSAPSRGSDLPAEPSHNKQESPFDSVESR